MMDVTERQAWDQCLSLWKVLANMPDTYSIRKIRDFKNNILVRLGIGRKLNGCPFCDVYYGTANCPIGKCSDINPCMTRTVYCEWSGCFVENDVHMQKFAKKFYEYLLELSEERGY